ncbi:hypothetical protein ACFLZN_00485 [Nanoarchaeota archaeon]
MRSHSLRTGKHEKAIKKPFSYFLSTAFVSIFAVALLFGLVIGLNAITNWIWGSYFILYLVAIVLMAGALHWFLRGLKEIVLFIYYLGESKLRTLDKYVGSLLFIVDFLLSDLLISLGFAGFSFVAINAAATNNWLSEFYFYSTTAFCVEVEIVFYIATGLFILGLYLQNLFVGDHVSNKKFGKVYMETIATHSMTDKGILRRWLKSSRKVIHKLGAMSFPFIVMCTYLGIVYLSGFVAALYVQKLTLKYVKSFIPMEIYFWFVVVVGILGLFGFLYYFNIFTQLPERTRKGVWPGILAGIFAFFSLLGFLASKGVLAYSVVQENSMWPFYEYWYLPVLFAFLSAYSFSVFLYMLSRVDKKQLMRLYGKPL